MNSHLQKKIKNLKLKNAVKGKRAKIMTQSILGHMVMHGPLVYTVHKK